MTKWAGVERHFVAGVSLLFAAWLVACGSSNKDEKDRGGTAAPAPTKVEGERCSAENECPAGTACVLVRRSDYEYGICSRPCESDSECGSGLKCGTLAIGQRLCAEPCSSDSTDTVCVDGAQVACEAAPESHCRYCGCPDHLRCVAGTGCRAKAALGETCFLDAECETDNCDIYLHVCRVPVGRPCTIDNCERCETKGQWSYCSRECRNFFDCNGAGHCVTYGGHPPAGGGVGSCEPDCSSLGDPSCPGDCVSHIDPTGLEPDHRVCLCSGCMILEQLRPVGARCNIDSECESGQCTDFFCTQQ